MKLLFDTMESLPPPNTSASLKKGIMVPVLPGQRIDMCFLLMIWLGIEERMWNTLKFMEPGFCPKFKYMKALTFLAYDSI